MEYLWHQMPTEATGCEHFKARQIQLPKNPFYNPVNVSIPDKFQKEIDKLIKHGDITPF